MSKSAIFIQIPGVIGSATEANHKGWIPVESCNWRVKRDVVTSIGNANERYRTGRMSFSTFVFIKEKDVSSVKLFEQILTMTTHRQVTIHICDAVNNGLQTYLEYVLDNVIITHFEEAVSTNNKRPKELIAFDFTKVQKKHTPYDSNNKPQTPMVTAFELATGRPPR